MMDPQHEDMAQRVRAVADHPVLIDDVVNDWNSRLARHGGTSAFALSLLADDAMAHELGAAAARLEAREPALDTGIGGGQILPDMPPGSGPAVAWRLPDGRRQHYLQIGAPWGRTFIWTISTVGLGRWHPDAEAALAAAGFRMIVPIRAGFGRSDPHPRGCPVHDTACADMIALMDHLQIGRCPIVTPTDDIRIGLMLARAHPRRVSGIIGIGAAFPVSTPEQYARMHPTARFFRINARYAPAVLAFGHNALRAAVKLKGIEWFLRTTLRNAPADLAVIRDPRVVEAITSGLQVLRGEGVACGPSFAAEVAAFHGDWPAGLGEVDCPVTLFHGEQDQNAPFETVRDYCRDHPRWRLISYADEGQLVGYARWRDIFGLLERVT